MILTGIAYPHPMTAIAQVTFTDTVNDSNVSDAAGERISDDGAP